MKKLFTLSLLATAAVGLFSCEKHSWSETKENYKEDKAESKEKKQ